MSGEIQELFNKYQKKYPLYTKNAIVDKMLSDGAINQDIAKKIKSGVSLFLIENNYINNTEKKSINITEILGGNFSNKKINQKPQTHFNRQIENTFQSNTQGDCWLLSDINALNYTDWGKKAIHDAIIPDNNGGVTIKFKGSPLKQKSFHVSSEEIFNAKKSGNYSKGDDDMIAFELATEKLAKMIEKAGLGKRITSFDDKTNYKTYIAGGGIYDKDGNTLNISTLITGKKHVTLMFLKATKVPDEILKNMSQNNDIAAVCSFDSWHDLEGRDKNDPVHGNHAYAIKRIDYGKSVTIIDPYHTDKEIKLSWEKFMYDVDQIQVATKDDSTKAKLESLIPQKLKNEVINTYKESVKLNDKTYQQQKDVQILDKTFPEVANILIGFDISEKDINFKRVNETIKTDFLKNNDFENKYRCIRWDIQKSGKRIPTTEKITKDNVILLLDIKPDFIQFLDEYKSGWGNGKEKKQLITPIINALAEKAKEIGINSSIINEFKAKCSKELNAIFYTDANVIEKEAHKIIKLIKSKDLR